MAQRRYRDKAYGRYDRGVVDAEPVREHMMLLAEFGIGYKRAAKLAGIGVTSARTLIWGRQEPGPRCGELQKHVKRETAEALLSVKPDISNLADGAVIPARGAHRRIQALAAIGWSLHRQAHHLGENMTNFSRAMQNETITVRRHRAIAAMFDEWWAAGPIPANWREQGGITRAIRHAKQRRWLPPLAWDDIDNDTEPPIPDVEDGAVDEIAIELAMHGDTVRLSPLERREAIRRLHAQRWSDQRIAAALHCADRTVLRIRQELGLEAFEYGDLVKERAA